MQDVHSQLIYSVDSEWKADLNVYVVSSEWQADLSVFKVGSSWQADGNEGKWFFTDSEWKADKKVYFDRSVNDVLDKTVSQLQADFEALHSSEY